MLTMSTPTNAFIDQSSDPTDPADRLPRRRGGVEEGEKGD